MNVELEHSERRQGVVGNMLRHELHHLRSHWLWIMLLSVLLVVAGTAAIIVPPATVGTTFAAVIFLGVLLMVGGVATIVSSFWIGKWGGFLVQLLVGILYVACGFVVTENPAISALTMTVFVAVSFIVLGVFRSVGALVLRFPQWGWALLNGVVTLLAGVVIYRQLPQDALWVIGLLVGLEMLFNVLAMGLNPSPSGETFRFFVLLEFGPTRSHRARRWRRQLSCYQIVSEGLQSVVHDFLQPTGFSR